LPHLFFQNVDEFRAEIAENDELPFGALDLQSGISTAAASGAQTPQRHNGRDTPNENSILLKRKKLGRGSFSVVHHVWDVSTGLEYALKKFRDPIWVGWKKEASIMMKTSHVSCSFYS
jgi:serine/threonine-protein kinase Chk2